MVIASLGVACSLLSFHGIDAIGPDAAADGARADSRDTPSDATIADASLPIKDGLVLWVRAAPSEVDTDGGVRWKDRSVSSSDLVQVAPERSPQWAPGALGGLDAVHFAPGNVLTIEKDLFTSTVVDGYSIFVVCRLSQPGKWLSMGTGSTTFEVEATAGGVVLTVGTASSSAFGVVELGATHVYAVVVEPNKALVVREDADGGTKAGSWMPSAAARARRDFGGAELDDGGAVVQSAVGDYAEVAVFGRAVSPAELSVLMSHFATVWKL